MQFFNDTPENDHCIFSFHRSTEEINSCFAPIFEMNTNSPIAISPFQNFEEEFSLYASSLKNLFWENSSIVPIKNNLKVSEKQKLEIQSNPNITSPTVMSKNNVLGELTEKNEENKYSVLVESVTDRSQKLLFRKDVINK
mmetsp:Transcript_17359/g.19445  ORF Transcript_17359/g.19445 Transcript_17359/m.19445 type:complete len:140 (-) Transcript_17359:483-902(-)